MKVVKTFKSDITMSQWLANPQNIEDLKKKYPPKRYAAEINLIEKQVEIREKQPNPQQL